VQSAKARRQLHDEINITPLTDVFLVLLIIMMVVAPLLHVTRTDIQPPQVEAGAAINKAKLLVEVTRDGIYFVEGVMTDQANLAAALTAGAAKFDEKDVVIRADRATRAGVVLKIFEAAKQAQYAKLTVVVENLATQREQELREQAVQTPPQPVAPAPGTVPVDPAAAVAPPAQSPVTAEPLATPQPEQPPASEAAPK